MPRDLIDVQADQADVVIEGVAPPEPAGLRENHPDEFPPGKGSVFADWDAAFRTWLNNAVKFRDERGGGKSSAPQQSFRRIEEL